MSRPTEFQMNLTNEATPTPQQYDPKCTNDGGTPLSEIHKKNTLIQQHRGTFSRDARFRQYTSNAFNISNPLLGPGSHRDQENFKKLTQKACKTIIMGQNYESKYGHMNDLLLRGSAGSSQSSQQRRSKLRNLQNRPISSASSNDDSAQVSGWQSQKQKKRKAQEKEDYGVYSSGRQRRRPASSLPRSSSASRSPSVPRFASLKRKNSEKKQMPSQMFIQCTNLIQITPMRGDIDRRLNYMMYKQDSNAHRSQIDNVMKRKKLKSKTKAQEISIRPSGYGSLVPVEKRTRNALQEQPTIKEVTQANQKQLSNRILKQISREKMMKYAQKRRQMYNEFFGVNQSREGSKSSQRRQKKSKKPPKPEDMPEVMKSELLEQGLFVESGGPKRKFNKDLREKGEDHVDERVVAITQLRYNDVENVMEQQIIGDVQNPEPVPVVVVASPEQKQSNTLNHTSEYKTSSKTLAANQDILDIKFVSNQAKSRTNMDIPNDQKDNTVNSQRLAMQSTQQPNMSSMQSSFTFHNDIRGFPDPLHSKNGQKSFQQRISKARSRPMSAKNATSFTQKNILMKSSLRRRGAGGVGPGGYQEYLLSKGSHRTLRSNNNQVQEQIIQEEDDINNSIHHKVLSPGSSSQMQISTNQPQRQSKKFAPSTTNNSLKPPRGSITSKTIPNQAAFSGTTQYNQNHLVDQRPSNQNYLDNYKTVIQSTFKERPSSQKVKKRASQSGRTTGHHPGTTKPASPARFMSNNSSTANYNQPSSSNQIDSNDVLQHNPSAQINMGNSAQVPHGQIQPILKVPNTMAMNLDSQQQPLVPSIKNSRPMQLQPLTSKSTLKSSLFSPVLTQENLRVQFEIANQQEQLRKASSSPKRQVPTTKLDAMAKQMHKQAKDHVQKRASSRGLLEQQKNQIKDARKLKQALNTLINNADPQTLNQILNQKKVNKLLKQQAYNENIAQQMITSAQLSDSTLQSIPEQFLKTIDNNRKGTEVGSPTDYQVAQPLKVRGQPPQLPQQTVQMISSKPSTTTSLELAHIYDPHAFTRLTKPSSTKSSFRRRRVKRPSGPAQKMEAQQQQFSPNNEYMVPAINEELQFHFQTAPQEYVMPDSQHLLQQQEGVDPIMIQTMPGGAAYLASIEHPRATFIPAEVTASGGAGNQSGPATLISEPNAITVGTEPGQESDQKVIHPQGQALKRAAHEGSLDLQPEQPEMPMQLEEPPPMEQTTMVQDSQLEQAEMPVSELEPVQSIGATNPVVDLSQDDLDEQALSQAQENAIAEANADLIEVVADKVAVPEQDQQEENAVAKPEVHEDLEEVAEAPNIAAEDDQKQNQESPRTDQEAKVEEIRVGTGTKVNPELQESREAVKSVAQADIGETQEPTESQTNWQTQAVETEGIGVEAATFAEPAQEVMATIGTQEAPEQAVPATELEEEEEEEPPVQRPEQPHSIDTEPQPAIETPEVVGIKASTNLELATEEEEESHRDEEQGRQSSRKDKASEKAASAQFAESVDIKKEEKEEEIAQKEEVHQEESEPQIAEKEEENQAEISRKSSKSNVKLAEQSGSEKHAEEPVVDDVVDDQENQYERDDQLEQLVEQKSPEKNVASTTDDKDNIVVQSQNRDGQPVQPYPFDREQSSLQSSLQKNSSELNAQVAVEYIENVLATGQHGAQPLQQASELNRASQQSSILKNSSELNAQVAAEYIDNILTTGQKQGMPLELQQSIEEIQGSLQPPSLKNSSELNAQVANEYVERILGANQERMKIENQQPKEQSQSERESSEQYSSDQVEQRSSQRAEQKLSELTPEAQAEMKDSSVQLSTTQKELSQSDLAQSQNSSAQNAQAAVDYIGSILEANELRLNIRRQMAEHLQAHFRKHLAMKVGAGSPKNQQAIADKDAEKVDSKLPPRLPAARLPPAEIPPAGRTARLRDIPSPTASQASASPVADAPIVGDASAKNSPVEAEAPAKKPPKPALSFQVMAISPSKQAPKVVEKAPAVQALGPPTVSAREPEQSQSQLQPNSHTTSDQVDKEVEQIIDNYQKNVVAKEGQQKNPYSNYSLNSQPSQWSYLQGSHRTPPLPGQGAGKQASHQQLLSAHGQIPAKQPATLTTRQNPSGQGEQPPDFRPRSSQEQRLLRSKEEAETVDRGDEERGVDKEQIVDDYEESRTVATGLREMAQVIERDGEVVRLPVPLEESASSSIVVVDQKSIRNMESQSQSKAVSGRAVHRQVFTLDNPFASQKLVPHDPQLSIPDHAKAGAGLESEAAAVLHGYLADAQPPAEQRDPGLAGQSQITQSNLVSSKETPNARREGTAMRAEIQKGIFKEDGRKSSLPGAGQSRQNSELADGKRDLSRGDTELQQRFAENIEKKDEQQSKYLDMRSVPSHTQPMNSWTERIPQESVEQEAASRHSSSLQLRVASSIHINDGQRQRIVGSKSGSEEQIE